MIASLVSALFDSCSPSTIIRLIISIIVFPLDTVFGRRCWSHICDETTKVIPAFANRNAASAIILICFEILVGAALPHHSPDAVFIGSVLTMGFATPIMHSATTTALAGHDIVGYLLLCFLAHRTVKFPDLFTA